MNSTHVVRHSAAFLCTLAILAILAPLHVHAAASIEREVLVRIPIEGTGGLANGCTGEPIAWSGYLTSNLHITEDASGGRHFHYQVAAQHVTATGLTSGTSYQFPGGYSFTFTSTGEQVVRHYVLVDGHLVGRGPNNNMFFHNRIHLTINADGEVTASFAIDEMTCNG